MRYYIQNQQGTLELNDAGATEGANTAVKVRIEKSLLSYGDLLNYRTKKNKVIPGRYAVGTVGEAPENSAFQKGQRVVISSKIQCGQCFNCKKGDANGCSDTKQLGVDVDGIYRDFALLQESCLYALPDVVSFECALFTEHISLALNALDRLNIERGDHIAILSDTKLGLIVGQLALYYGAIPILINKDAETTQLARQLGIFYTSSHQDTEDVVRNVFMTTGGRMCEKVVYIKDGDFSLADVDKLCANQASVCIMLCDREKIEFDIAQVVKKQLSIYGLSSPLGNFPSALNLLATKQIDVSALIGEHITFEQLPQTIETLTFSEIATKSIIIDC